MLIINVLNLKSKTLNYFKNVSGDTPNIWLKIRYPDEFRINGNLFKNHLIRKVYPNT